MGALNVAAYFTKFCNNIAIPLSKRATMSSRKKSIAKRINKISVVLTMTGIAFMLGL